ncbi:hypothetical protein BABINDRAFT_158901 [Babjeviella inositovora NRRL Y-12698]|uniref:C2H2-type domain-containing protein n=1 Tax=Babjeviella inositovora NRRL Y-12698 TaxID=984486 RepID=A0A1E3QX93_9ASCO|nr:uncharacterized protein BABINDRAFT_158901 [Babjeviella inositovora NRRL Y-12698]ODQ82270.1 hypothetical protein BABINDRAFT_158901 [Babjeviella inositovora NRRL Y-12698]
MNPSGSSNQHNNFSSQLRPQSLPPVRASVPRLLVDLLNTENPSPANGLNTINSASGASEDPEADARFLRLASEALAATQTQQGGQDNNTGEIDSTISDLLKRLQYYCSPHGQTSNVTDFFQLGGQPGIDLPNVPLDDGSHGMYYGNEPHNDATNGHFDRDHVSTSPSSSFKVADDYSVYNLDAFKQNARQQESGNLNPRGAISHNQFLTKQPEPPSAWDFLETNLNALSPPPSFPDYSLSRFYATEHVAHRSEEYPAPRTSGSIAHTNLIEGERENFYTKRPSSVVSDSSSSTSTGSSRDNHGGRKPYICSNCLLSFRRSSDLRRHQKAHLVILPNICDNCGKGFARKDALKRHTGTLTCKRNREKNYHMKNLELLQQLIK